MFYLYRLESFCDLYFVGIVGRFTEIISVEPR